MIDDRTIRRLTAITLTGEGEQRAFDLFEFGDLRSNVLYVVENHSLDIAAAEVAFNQPKEFANLLNAEAEPAASMNER